MKRRNLPSLAADIFRLPIRIRKSGLGVGHEDEHALRMRVHLRFLAGAISDPEYADALVLELDRVVLGVDADGILLCGGCGHEYSFCSKRCGRTDEDFHRTAPGVRSRIRGPRARALAARSEGSPTLTTTSPPSNAPPPQSVVSSPLTTLSVLRD